jgi:hypothetical protein
MAECERCGSRDAQSLWWPKGSMLMFVVDELFACSRSSDIYLGRWKAVIELYLSCVNANVKNFGV